MRIGTLQSYQSQLSRMSDLQADIAKLQGQISTGKAVEAPSDNPPNAHRIAAIAYRTADNAQYMRNMDAATTRLSLAEGAVEGMQTIVNRALELTLTAANGTMTEGDRRSIAVEVGLLVDEMMSLANTRDATGQYIFAGAAVGAPAFVADASGAIRFQGGGDPPSVPIGPDIAIDSGANGQVLLTTATPSGERTVFDTLVGLKQLLEAPAPTTDAERAARADGFAAALAGIHGGVERLATARASFGARLSAIDIEKERLAAGGVSMEIARSELEAVDVAAAVTKLQNAMTLLSASQQTFVQIRKLSLFEALS